MAARDGLAVVASGWSREDDLGVFDGEAGVVLCGADGSFLAEPGRDPLGWMPVVDLGVTEKDGVLYVQGHDGKAFRVKRFWK